MKLVDGVFKALDDRFDLKPFPESLFSPMPKWANWTYSFGGITFLLFFVQVVSGIYLTFFYTPSALDAWTSVKHIETTVYLGHFARSLHRWGAAILVVFLVAHTLRVLISRAYRSPRELIWWTGEGMLLLALAFVFTGYLLPWDIRAYWEVLITRNIFLQIPFIGNGLNAFLLFGGNLNQVPVARYFATHVVVLPLLISLAMMMHFLMIHRLGVAAKPGGDE